MIKNSRHVNYFATLDKSIQDDVLDKIDKLVQEEREYCDKGNYGHLCNMFSAIAIYEVLQDHGMAEDEAFKTVSEEMYKFLQSYKQKFQKLSKKSWFWSVMKKIIPLGFKKGSGIGWRYTWFDNQPKNEFKFETNECIYAKIFKKRGLEKLGPMFCKCDIINYGELDGIDFQRTKTLCYGDEKCDFRFVKHDANEEFVRFDSK